MTTAQLKDIARLSWQRLPPPAAPAPVGTIASVVARSTFEVRGNRSEVHLSESELYALLYLAADMRDRETR